MLHLSMSYIGVLNLEESVKKQIFDNNQICFLSDEQRGMVNDTFSLEYGGETRHYKMIDVWYAPREFSIKFLWRLCGLKNKTDLKENQNNDYAHIYVQVPWDKVQNMVVKS